MAQGEDDTVRSVCQYVLNIDRLTSTRQLSLESKLVENVETPGASYARLAT